jgi:hypothetical protein
MIETRGELTEWGGAPPRDFRGGALDAQGASHTPLRPGDLRRAHLSSFRPQSRHQLPVSTPSKLCPATVRKFTTKPVSETPFPEAHREVFLHSDCNENRHLGASRPRFGATYIPLDSETDYLVFPCSFSFLCCAYFRFLLRGFPSRSSRGAALSSCPRFRGRALACLTASGLAVVA